MSNEPKAPAKPAMTKALTSTSADVEALIERGLTSYGNGDVDGALMSWEQSLRLDPGNSKANGYVDYVRLHYDVLVSPSDDELSVQVPFGVGSDEPAYTIDVDADIADAMHYRKQDDEPAATRAASIDEGWFLEADDGFESASDHSSTAGMVTGIFETIVDEMTGPILLAQQHPMSRTMGESVIVSDQPSAALPPSLMQGPVTPLDTAHVTKDFARPTELTEEVDSAFEPMITKPVRPYGLGSALAAFDAESEFEGYPEPDYVVEVEVDEPTNAPFDAAAHASDVEARFAAAAQFEGDAVAEFESSAVSFGQVADPDGDPSLSTPESFADSPTSILQRDNSFVATRPRRKSAAPEFKMSLRTPSSLDDIDLDQHRLMTAGDADETQPEPLPQLPLIDVVAISDPAPLPSGTEDGSVPAFDDSVTGQLTGSNTRRPLPLPLPLAETPSLDFATPGRIEGAQIVENQANAWERDRLENQGNAWERDRRANQRTLESETDTQDISRQATLQISAGITAGAVTQAATHDDIDRPSTVPDLIIEPVLSSGDEPDEDESDFSTANTGNHEPLNFASPPPQTLQLPGLHRAPTEVEPIPSFDPLTARFASLLAHVDRNMPASESKDERTRRRISQLLMVAADCADANDREQAVAAVELAMLQEPESVLGQKLIHRHRDTILGILQQYLGNLARIPKLAKPIHELANTQMSSRAAFLSSRVDGYVSLEELLDITGMSRLETFRLLCQLTMRGVLL
jgi:hypothetical protein